ncbi:FtsX-like permease family protein [Arcobacteraceae bacterium]|nr:FtsX-like permease family protein [Arcobacteraceae bacterium]
MNKSQFFNFVLLQIYTNRTKHFSIFLISVLLIAILSSFIFISRSLSNDIKLTLDNHADFVLQKTVAGKVIDAPITWTDEIISLSGVTQVSTRVYGKYFYEPAEHYFIIVGVDLYDEQISSNLKKVVKNLDVTKFLSKKQMIIGSGVKEFLDEYHFFDYYTFRPSDKSIEKVYIYDTFATNSNIVSSDMIIMDIELAKKILGIDSDYVSDIVFNVPNQDEVETIKNKIRASHDFNIRILSKEDFYKAYEGLFNYKSTLFLVLYLIVLITFILIIYQRYSYINSSDKKEIGILRSIGWSINQIISLKIAENIIIFISSFILGLNLAYIYVFLFNAPVLSSLFLGFSNLPTNASFTPVIDISTITLLFLFFIVPIVAAILIPVWKISITEPTEAMK